MAIESKLDLTLLFSYAVGKAGMVDAEKARAENWVIPVDEKAAREIKAELQADRTRSLQKKK